MFIAVYTELNMLVLGWEAQNWAENSPKMGVPESVFGPAR